MEGPGKCHLCQEARYIRWCGMCKHWFCEDCRTKYWKRGYAAVMELVNGRQQANCCGPEESNGA